jgi:hypothetical protein
MNGNRLPVSRIVVMPLVRRSALALSIIALFSNPAFATDYAALPRAEVAGAVADGAAVVHDYGTFAWVAGSGKGASAEAVYAFTLGGRHFDPANDGAARASVYGNGKALRLVQFDGPVRQSWLESLAGDDVTVVQYIAPFGYVVWSDRAALANAQARSGALRFAGEFLPAYKTQNVKAGTARGEREWRAMVYRGANLDAAALSVGGARIGAKVQMDRQFDVVAIEGDAAAIDALAQLPGVYAIEPVPRSGGLRAELASQISANNLGANQLPVTGYLAWLTGRGVNGDGVKVADVDGGVFDTNPDIVNRMLPCVGDTCGGSATDDHGTHVAGIIAGDGSSGTVDSAGFLRGLGTAPGAKLIEQVYDPTFTQAGGMLKLMRQSHDNGADLSSNSWGPESSPRGYDGDTRQVDVGVRDTKPDVAGDQPLTYVLSIMNGNGGTSSQGTPDEAKNTITVGSTKAQNANLSVIAAFNDISSNSGHGPALDGRRIPHVVAPGCSVDSLVSATGYGTMCGTSMATPQVSGASALFIEKYRDAHAGTSPSAALIKAAMVAAAQDLAGNRDADNVVLGHRPDSKQGWGRLRLDWLLGATPTLYYDQNTRTFDNTGEDWTTSVTPADPAKPMQIVLVWTDAPGHGLGGDTPAWNNDLDLDVTVGATQYKGNVFDANGWSTSGGTADASNNIESVILQPSAGGAAATLRVAATNITSDALPNTGDATDQDFALICVNCVSRPDYTLALPTTRQAVCTTTAVTTQYAVDVGSAMGYTDVVNLSVGNVPAGATGSVSPASVTPPGSTSVQLGQLGAAAPGSYTLQLQAASTSGNRSVPLELVLANDEPAAPALTAPADAATNLAQRPTLTWAASAQADDYVVEVATDAAFANIVFTRTGKATSVTPDTDLASSTRYWWRVRPSNVCGVGATTAARTFTTLALPGDCAAGSVANTILADNVENGVNGWTASASGSNAQTWSISTARATSGTHAWLAPDVTTTSDQRLTSPTIALPSGQSPLTLAFQSDQSIEDSANGGCWDGGFLEISTNGGTSFTAIPAAAMLTDPYNGALGDGNPASGTQAWCGDPAPWTRSVVNLDAYAGQSVQLRLRFTSDGSEGRAPHGWYVDDIKVQGCTTALPDSIFANGFQ